jgi:hypothetical protein
LENTKIEQIYKDDASICPCFLNIKPTVQEVNQLHSRAGYTCARDSVSKATKRAGTEQSMGQPETMFLWRGSVGPRKQTSQEHNHTNFLSFHRLRLKLINKQLHLRCGEEPSPH